MIKDTEFYNEVSGNYSIVRYPEIANSYSQFFFKKRLELVKVLVEKNLKDNSGLLEIGCADGVVIGDLYKTHPNKFLSLVGIDISPKMIEAAKKIYSHKPIVFRLREDEPVGLYYDQIVEVGVINYANVKEEIEFISSKLKPQGIAVISYAGSNSAWNKIKKGNKGFKNLLSYKDFENELKNRFIIKKQKGVGIFLPIIWKIPTIARPLQRFFDVLFQNLLLNLYHEKIYLIIKK